MPTENRSSNTEMVSVPAACDLASKVRETLDRQACPSAWMVIAYEAVVKNFPASASQPHAEPIAWMVGTAFWWTKEAAERDAAATGLPIVGLGPMTDRAAVELAESETMAAIAELTECEAMAAMVSERDWAEHAGTGDVSSKVETAFTQLHNDLHEAGEKLAERDALLDRLRNHLIAKGVLGEFGPELFQILNIEAPERAAIATS